MKKIWLIGASVLVLAAGVALAEEVKGEGKPDLKAEKKTSTESQRLPELKDFTITGTLEKVELRNKDGSVKVEYQIAGKDGSVTRFGGRGAGKRGEPAVNFQDFAGAKVTAVGIGREFTRKGKTLRMINKLVSISKADAPIPVVPSVPVKP